MKNIKLLLFILFVSFIFITIINLIGYLLLKIPYLISYYYMLAVIISAVFAIWVFEPLSRIFLDDNE